MASLAYVAPANIIHGSQAELNLFLVFNMWPSHFGLPLLISIVLFSKKIQRKRHPTFINLCIAFIFIGISSCLLLYTGHTTGPEPPQMLCLLQSSLLYGMPALSSTAVFALVFEMFVAIRAPFHGVNISPESTVLRRWIMLSAPYLAWLACIIATASVGASHPDRLSRSRRFFYCSVDFAPLTNTLTVVAALILLATLVLEVWTLVIFCKHWKTVKGDTRGLAELNMPIRVLAFGLYVICALSLSLLSIKSPESPVPDLVIAFAASAVILIFGTQRDILQGLCFWCPAQQPASAAYSEKPLKSKMWISGPKPMIQTRGIDV
ncbi:hypothetical protein C8J56DRAFT_562591 [Mycena floridula]|nr:hypothetical protein C8J56DRAFT_562591 [Mycena floridula]